VRYVAAVTSIIFQRLRQPVVFGYLLAGMMVGRHVPIPLQADEQMVTTLSELGVTRLMFALGIEFSRRKLFAVGPTAGVIAVLQTTALVALGFLTGQLSGWTVLESIYAGAVIAISSTTIIVKAFGEQAITGRFVQVAFGVLIIEDLIAILRLVVLLLSLPVLAASRSFLPTGVGVAIVVVPLAGFGVAFWRSATNLEGHTRAGAEVIVAALAKEMAGSTARHTVDATAEHAVAPATRASRSLTEVYEKIPGLGEPVSLRLNDGEYAVGRSLGALDLRDTADATVLVILRAGEPVVLPVGREVLRAGDHLALADAPAALLAAGPAALSAATGRTP
jgi:hypothetical protein